MASHPTSHKQRGRHQTRIDFDFVFGTETGEILAEILDAEFFAYEA